MNILEIIVIVYLAIGFVYGLIELLFGRDVWYWFPINILLGPLNIVYLAYFTWSGKDLSRSMPTDIKLLSGKKAVIFDLDGTIVDTDEFWDEAFKKVIKSIDENINEAVIYTSKTGTNLSEKWSTIFYIEPELKAKIGSVEKAISLTETAYLEIIKDKEITPKDGFWECLTEFKKQKIKVGLTTNTRRSITEVVLAKLNIKDVFDITICGDEISKPKPDKEIYIKAMQALKVTSQQTLVFEDSNVGIESAISAGAYVVIVRTPEMDKDYFSKNIIGPFKEFKQVYAILNKTYKEYKSEYIDKRLPLVAQRLQELHFKDTSTSTKSTN